VEGALLATLSFEGLIGSKGGSIAFGP
jgi:hypothetical protein